MARRPTWEKMNVRPERKRVQQRESLLTFVAREPVRISPQVAPRGCRCPPTGRLGIISEKTSASWENRQAGPSWPTSAAEEWGNLVMKRWAGGHFAPSQQPPEPLQWSGQISHPLSDQVLQAKGGHVQWSPGVLEEWSKWPTRWGFLSVLQEHIYTRIMQATLLFKIVQSLGVNLKFRLKTSCWTQTHCKHSLYGHQKIRSLL